MLVKVEVEEALLGRDPDIAEDIKVEQYKELNILQNFEANQYLIQASQVEEFTLEKVTKERQRMEICEAIRSNFDLDQVKQVDKFVLNQVKSFERFRFKWFNI